jgi:antitoxin VapB
VNREIEIKTERVVDLLARECLGGVILNAQHNFSWITGGASNGVDLSRENGAASIFVRKDGRRFILASNIELGRMLAEEVAVDDFEPVEFSWQAEKSLADTVIRQARDLANGGEIASDISLHPGTRAIEGKIAGCRYQLTPQEMDRYRALGRDAGFAMRRVIDEIAPGESELEIAAKLRSELAAAHINSVVTLVAADDRIAKFRHPVPSANLWRTTVLLVTCAKRNGLIASLSRIVCNGEPPARLSRITESAAVVNARLTAATGPGTTGSALYETAAAAYADLGFADEIDKHHQGGATGYRTRDWVAHPKCAEIVQSNQAFAWNPSITGTKVEDTIIVTDDGIETVTSSPDFPLIPTMIDGVEYRSTGILSI